MSIYNTSHSRRAGAARSPNTQHAGALPPRLIQRRPPPPRQQQQPINIPYNDFQLMSCKKRGKHHVMDFKTNKPVDFNNFARPVKLQRKDNNNHGFGRMHRMANGGNSTPNASQGSSSNSAAGNSQDAAGSSSQQQQQHQQQHGPKTGADTSLIAPLGGATRNKQMLFKKRTKQIYLAKEDARELKEQEHKPWILEDYDGQNSYTGSYEGSQRSDYVFFVVSGNDFKVVPVDRWYKFQQKRNVATFTLEEAEEQLKNLQKREQSRWMMLDRNKAMADAESQSQSSQGAKSRFKKTDHGESFGGGSDDEGGGTGRRDRHDSDIDDLDFDDVFQDDEEGGGEHEMEDEDTRESKERLKRETKGYAPGGDEEAVETMDDESNRLTSEGKQIRKLVRTLEKNGAYESDEDKDPYASSEEEMESDAEKEESKSEAENSQQKKTIVPPKKKGPAPSSKTAAAKKSHASKIKKEGLSRPIGRPGSPSLQQGKASPPPAQRATSPIHQRMREISPGAAPVKKRKSDEGDHGETKRPKSTTTAPPAPASAASPGGGDDSLITEDEVIQTLRGKKLTTKEFLMHFRKRIKKNEKNREIITGLLKKVARHNTSEQDPTKRVLELRPDLQ